LVPALFSKSFKAVSKSNFSSGEGLVDMALRWNVGVIVQAVQQIAAQIMGE
jgi:hypothetical protein